MTPRTRIILAAVLSPLLLGAVTVPTASDKPALNLEHYLEYQAENKIDLQCRADKAHFVCTARDQKIEETGENNATTVTAFKKAEIRFNAAVELQLQKPVFEKTMQEIERTEKERRKLLASEDPDFVMAGGPMEDDLERALVGNLEHISVDGFDFTNSSPRSHVGIENITFDNAMKKTAKNIAFSERVLGTMTLSYTGALIDTNDSADFYRMLPQMLEEAFDTNDTRRAEYVGGRLEALAKERLKYPVSGAFSVKTAYLGNDAVSVDIDAFNRNTEGEKDTFEFTGELRNASTIFKPARRPLTPGTPDFLFKSLHSYSSSDGSDYRALLKNDKTFAGYIAQYDSLIRAYFDKKIARFKQNAVLAGWFGQAKTALSKIVTGQADTLDITVRNKSGVTAMQVFGMLMGQMMAMPPQPGTNAAPDQEKIIAETAAQNLEVRIEAK